MSFHQRKAIKIVISRAIRFGVLMFLFIRTNPEKTIAKALLEAKIGHGLTSTRWKGLNLFIILYFTSVTYSVINVMKT